VGTAFAVFTAAVLTGFALAGYIGPARDLRKREQLGLRPLLTAYREHVASIPEALFLTTRGALRHPWSWDGPILGWVLFIGVLLLGALVGLIQIAFGPDRVAPLGWVPLCLFLGIGNGIALVREFRSYAAEDR
jgi:hypothetical protein